MNICKLKNNDVIYLENNSTINYHIDLYTTLQIKEMLRCCKYIKRSNKTIYEKIKVFDLSQLKENDLIYLFNNDCYNYSKTLNIVNIKEEIKTVTRDGIVIAYRKHKLLSLQFNNRYNYDRKRVLSNGKKKSSTLHAKRYSSIS